MVDTLSIVTDRCLAGEASVLGFTTWVAENNTKYQ